MSSNSSLTASLISSIATAPAEVRPRITWMVRSVNLLVVIIPPVGFAVAIFLLWGVAFSAVHLLIFLTTYLLTGFGVTIGFHRLFTHRSFATSAPVRFILGMLGSMALEGPLLKWVAQHRKHHQHSDEENDPHSPHLHGHGFWGMLRGLWHAHAGWLFDPDAPDLYRYVGDLQKDKTARVVSRLFLLWVVLGFAVPAALGGLLTWSWMGVLLGLLWSGLVRVFLVHHVTWSINSICHLWGSRPFRSDDESRNNLIFGFIGMGEGWHNNHHAFPSSARHGLRWWELDVSYLIIRLMAMLHLVWNIRLPDAQALAAKRRYHLNISTTGN